MEQRLETLNEFAVTLLMQSDLAGVVWTIADRIGSILGFEDCVIYLLDDGTLSQVAAYGEKKFGQREIRERIRIPVGKGIVGSVAASGLPEIIADTQQDSRYIWDQFSGRSELTVPIVYEDRVLGVIDSEAAVPNAFNDDDLQFMQALANITAPRIASELAKLRLGETEALLRQNQDMLHCTVEAVSDGIITFDSEGRIHSVNAAVEKIFGYRREELVGNDCRMFVPPASADLYHDRLMRLVEGSRENDDLSGVEIDGLRRDGRVFPMETNIRLATLHSGSKVVVATVHDITDRKAARAALTYRIEFENLVSSISSRFINLRADEVDDGIETALRQIGEFVNADAAYVFRFFDDHELYSQTHLWRTEHSLTRREQLQDMKVEELPWWMHQLTAGTTVAVDSVDALPDEAAPERSLLQSVNIKSIIEVPMSHQGVVTGYLGLSCTREYRRWTEDEQSLLELVGQIVSNALQHKETEQALLRSRADAQAASRAKSQFLANMSHELRTPLNAIIGYSEILRTQPAVRNDSTVTTQVGNIVKAGKHLLNVISDILDLAKIESGRTSFVNECFSLPDLVSEISATAAPLMRENDNQFNVICDAEAGTMCGDPTRVQQILLNLLGNAAKFTENGQVTFEVAVTTIDGRDCASFSVTDSGIGIPQDKLDHIFSEFEQVDGSDTRRHGGTGLGLAISKRICRLMGGDITVTSREGIGSKFTTVLPLGEANEAAGDRAA